MVVLVLLKVLRGGVGVAWMGAAGGWVGGCQAYSEQKFEQVGEWLWWVSAESGWTGWGVSE